MSFFLLSIYYLSVLRQSILSWSQHFRYVKLFSLLLKRIVNFCVLCHNDFGDTSYLHNNQRRVSQPRAPYCHFETEKLCFMIYCCLIFDRIIRTPETAHISNR